MTNAIQQAASLARDLAGRDLDPNAVAQAYTYLRVLLNRAGDDDAAQQKAVDTWWEWLDTVSGRGADAVVRSNRTVYYFRETKQACQRHLKQLEPDEALAALAWAVRLLRYYQSDPRAPTWFNDALPPAPGPARPRNEPRNEPRAARPRNEPHN